MTAAYVERRRAEVASYQQNRPTYWRTWRGRRRTSLAGDAVHRDGCLVIPRERACTPWRLMDDQPEAVIREMTAIDHLLHLCAVCFTGAPLNKAGATVSELALPPRSQVPTLTFEQQFALADMLKTADLPPSFRGKPGNILMACQFAEMIGVRPMTVMAYAAVVEGKLAPMAEMQAALVTSRGGHTIKVWHEGEGQTLKGICQITRGDTGETRRVEFTHDDAVKADLLKKDTYKKYERRMLKHRAVTECVSDVCPEVLMGLDVNLGASPPPIGVDQDEADDDVADAELVDETPEPEVGQGAQGKRTPADLQNLIKEHAVRLFPGQQWDDQYAEVEGEFHQIYEHSIRNATPEELAAFEADLAQRHPAQVTQ